MGLWRILQGSLRVRITSAAIENTLTSLNESGVLLRDIVRVNEMEVEFTLHRSDFRYLKRFADCSGCILKILERKGLLWTILSLKDRPVFLSGLIAFFILIFSLPTRILFVQIEGNSTVSSVRIVEQAQQAGIYLGAQRSHVRSEKVKNELLASMPELQWVGVNTYGCIAVISVKERSVAPQQSISGISSIVARCDGIVDEIEINRGNLLCKVGQAVTQGQVLVSGYTDCGISIKADSADAEIYARTFHDLRLVVPDSCAVRTTYGEKTIKFSIIFGKKYIKLYKDSGISDTACVKIYSQRYLTLPGGYVLPIGYVKETWISYNLEDIVTQEEDVSALVTSVGNRYIIDSMISGEILSSSIVVLGEDNDYKFACKYYCREMIGKVVKEEIVDANEQRN